MQNNYIFIRKSVISRPITTGANALDFKYKPTIINSFEVYMPTVFVDRSQMHSFVSKIMPKFNKFRESQEDNMVELRIEAGDSKAYKSLIFRGDNMPQIYSKTENAFFRQEMLNSSQPRG